MLIRENLINKNYIIMRFIFCMMLNTFRTQRFHCIFTKINNFFARVILTADHRIESFHYKILLRNILSIIYMIKGLNNINFTTYGITFVLLFTSFTSMFRINFYWWISYYRIISLYEKKLI